MSPRPGDEKGGLNQRNVYDPITEEHVGIYDSSKADLDKAYEDYRQNTADSGALDRSKSGNYLFFEHPPPDWKLHHDNARAVVVRYIAFAAVVSIAASLLPRSWNIVAGIGIASAGAYILRMLDSSFEDIQWASERQRGTEATRQNLPESVEWLNTLVEKIWPLIDNQLFRLVTDQLEDIMQATVPSVIESIKIVELHQGSTPVRILSMRALSNEEMHKSIKSSKDSRDGSSEEDEEKIGSFVNVEISFVYRSKPSGIRLKHKLDNARLLIDFFIGMKKLSAIKMPVFVGVEGMPFAKEVTVSFMGLPRVEISAMPLSQKLPNVMGLPLISGFVAKSIDLATNAYCAPRSLTVDVSELLMGDGFRKSLDSFGILLVNIHRAEGLMKADTTGSSDPYVVLQFSRLAKPLFSTRIIVNDLFPNWEETAIILVTDDAVKADERLSVQLWDSDRLSADDQLGHVDVSLRDLIRKKGIRDSRQDALTGETPFVKTPGTLFWDVTFYGLRSIDKSDARATAGQDPRIPDDLREQEPELGRHGLMHETPFYKTPPVVFVPPDPDYMSGVLYIAVIQVADLSFKSRKGTFGSRKGHTIGQESETDQHEDEHDEEVPSSYVDVHLNDVPIYRSRVKPLASNAVFNAGCERFVPNWQQAQIMFVVRQKGIREEDALLGVLPIRLADVLRNASCVSQWSPISGGIGSGNLRIGVLFRSVDVKLPRQMLSYDVGTLEILDDVRVYDFTHPDMRVKLGNTRLKMTTYGARYKVRSAVDEENQIIFRIDERHKPLRLPLKKRDASCLVLSIDSVYKRLMKAETVAVAKCYIRDLPTEEALSLQLPLYTCNNIEGFIQNHLDEKHREQYCVDQIATILVKVRFKQGLGYADRSQELMREEEQKDLIEAWDAAINAGLPLQHIYAGPTPSHEGLEEGRDSSSTDVERDDQEGADGDRIRRARTSVSQRTQQTGIYASKTVRTLSWVSQGVKKRASRLRHTPFEHKGRTADAMEQEGAAKGSLNVIVGE